LSHIFPQNLLHFVQSRSTVRQSGFPAPLGFTTNHHDIRWLINAARAIPHLRKIQARRP
jgi:hypothetical protein